MNQIKQSLDLKQSQNLVMTPQLQQAIKMLQLTNQELSELVDQEIEHNPLLEKADPEGDGTEHKEAEQKDNIEEQFDKQWEDEAPQRKDQTDFDSGSDWADVGSGGNSSFESTEQSFENAMSKDKSLRDHLTEQMYMTFADPKDTAVAAQLIDRLDAQGFLRDTPEDLAEKIGCKPERLLEVLKELQQFDPTGVFASDIKDCFRLQLEEKNRFDPAMAKLLDNLELLAEHDMKALQDICGVDGEDLKQMVTEVRALNPKPISEFDHFVVQTAIPDALMKKIPKSEGGGWRVVLNTATLPRVLINNEYYDTVSKSAVKKEDKQYINERMASASWLVRAMDQRAQTILKVASKIVEKQYAFFLYGVEYLTTMTLRDIAEEIDMHESTVSRVTTNKYIGTPRGIFELKYFFSSGVSGAGGTDISAEAVKAKIKGLIEKEAKPKDVLSDDKIADILKEDGVDIARRTVAKYREAMNYGSSVQRRKILKNKS